MLPRWVLLAACLSVNFSLMIVVGMVAPVFPPHAKNKGIDSVTVGAVFSALPFAQTALSPMAGHWCS